ncbi:glycosyltransferase [Paenibacillus albidus]|uniref:glycosyltransferase n=1 Tax=Paenibacillus albidus TaxID=2041023 RepID=UPI001BE854E8|nr:glycosyltransferase [Paenibacillus albidus]MBT2290572.1 glycosyltransferase [Paenibacillus albidus]
MRILYISLLDWYFTKQRPQHIAELLSEKNEVKYICRSSWRTKHIKKHDENEHIYNDFNISESLHIERMRYLPFNKYSTISFINEFFYKLAIEKTIIKYQPDILWLTHPEHYDLIPQNFKGKIIYDCMDNYSQFTRDDKKRAEINALEKKLVNKSNLVLTSSNGLEKKISGITTTTQVVTIKNAADFTYFNTYYSSTELKKRPVELKEGRRIVGYFGGISSWFDIDLLVFIAENHKECDFVIIGPLSNENVVAKASKIENILFLGPKIYNELAAYLYYFDVCIMPFLVNDLIKDVNPIKLYEYLSMGKPVIVPQYDEILEFVEYVYFARNQEDFSRKLGEALAENSTELIKKRIEFAKTNTWNYRVDEINKLIN